MTAIIKRGGFVLPSAIFLLVMLAALGAFILTVSTTQQTGQALDVEGERVYQAANAGMEWVRFRVATDSACPPNTAWGGSTFSFNFSGTSTLAKYYATVQCISRETTKVNDVSTTVFEVKVTACNRPNAGEPRCPGNASQLGYVERELQGLLGI